MYVEAFSKKGKSNYGMITLQRLHRNYTSGIHIVSLCNKRKLTEIDTRAKLLHMSLNDLYLKTFKKKLYLPQT